MSRDARQRGESDVYHVVSRGVNQCLIFEDDKDRKRFLELTEDLLEECPIELYCWCLMGNHFHLLMHGALDDISLMMKRLLSKYASFFNMRHGRSGHLFQDRFRSEAVDTDEYLMVVVRYIHRNPVKAGLSRLCSYQWSSYDEYLGSRGLCATERVLAIFGGTDSYEAFHGVESEDECLDVPNAKKRIRDAEAIELLEAEYGKGIVGGISKMPAEERNEVLRTMKRMGISIRQAQRLTGVGRGIIERA